LLAPSKFTDPIAIMLITMLIVKVSNALPRFEVRNWKATAFRAWPV